MRTILHAALCIGFAAGPSLLLAGSTDPEPVRWTTSATQTPVRAGQTINVVLHADIQAGWHLYALNEPDGGPHATDIGIAQGDIPDLLSASENPPVERYDTVMARRLRFHLDHADFKLQLSIPADTPAGPHTVHLLTRFQACSDKLCLPPRTRSITTVLSVRAV